MSDRNKRNRKFLHDLATPIAILELVVKRMYKIKTGSDKGEGEALESEEKLLLQAQRSLDKIKDLHADFKEIQTQRELEDKKKSAS